jgi:hypothetical protein
MKIPEGRWFGFVRSHPARRGRFAPCPGTYALGMRKVHLDSMNAEDA